MQIDKPSMSMYASLEDYRKALAEWQWQLGVVAFHGIDTEAETDGVFVVIGTTDPEVFAQEIQKAKLLRESKDDEGYEHDTPLQAWAALQDGVWNFDASEDTPGACPALVANLRWELPDDDQGHPCGHQCSGCDVPKHGLYQIAEPSTSATPTNGKGWGCSCTSMIDGHAVSSESDCTPRIHSMSQYASKDDMLKAVMAENEQLRAQLAAAQQGVLLTNEQIESIEKQVWDLNHFDEVEREGNRKFAHLIAAATRAATQGLDAKVQDRLDRLYLALEVCSAELFAQCADQGRAMKYVDQARSALAAEQCARAAIPPAAQELSADALDAKRYRWLRRKVCIVGGKFHILNLDPRYIAPDAAIELDSAIDAAIAAQAKQGGAANG